MMAIDKLLTKNRERKFICVGLDSDIDKIPANLKSSSNPILDFNQAIISFTKSAVAAYKINFAFYEKDGEKGLRVLSETVESIPRDILIIADAKRGDIGNTSLMYAKSVFDHYNFDAVTLNPLMGRDSLEPFLDYKDKLNFILTLTSNKGAADFEKLKLDNGKFLYQQIIEKIVDWNSNNNCGLVFGATNTNELVENINSFDSLPVLLPGVGAQGASVEDVIAAFKSAGRSNFLINVSRGIIYSSEEEDFAEKAAEELLNYNKKIDSILKEA
ncbi:MAG: orotidine-5'-phosphate decarboxylase [Ignavibacterium sp.]|nr:MAG: orotidine-5'-phosphate decarboxylase [Ignavibacterium sp.]